ncbi:hypothetical protein CSKR_201848 [Clonorchis sinensis]|uniref:Uncharacterized protein n=1 Tax=Clonorchis sinensis TaxID=79923 RepID=A0A8T1MWM3_CLOSI|nr:hypothetical protein CSKR_201848 [Clonorchis sinensis]
MNKATDDDCRLDQEFIDKSVRPVLSELIETLLTRRPSNPVDYIADCLNVSTEESALDGICQRLAGLQIQSAMFAFECNRAYGKLHELIRELRPAPLIGELTSKLIQCLLRSTYGKDLLVSNLQLEKRTYISSNSFKRIMTLALTFKNFSIVCDQLYRIEHVSHKQILRYIEDVIKSDDQRAINPRRSFMLDNTEEDETNSMTYDDFMQNALLVFVGKPTGPTGNVRN